MLKNSLSLVFVFFYLLFSASVFSLPSDKTQNIEITADSAELNEQLGLMLYHGNVIIKQGTVLIQAETITVKTTTALEQGEKKLEEITTVGSPSYFQQQVSVDGNLAKAQAKTILYKVTDDKVTLIGNAHLEQAGRIISGDRVLYDIAEQKVLAQSQESQDGKTQRVKLIIPKKNQSTPNKQPTQN